MLLAGGGLRHAPVIGSTETDDGKVRERPVTPGELAATIDRHLGAPLDSTDADTAGRVSNRLPSGAEPVKGLLSNSLEDSAQPLSWLTHGPTAGRGTQRVIIRPERVRVCPARA